MKTFLIVGWAVLEMVGLPAVGRAQEAAKVFAIWPGAAPGSEARTGAEQVRLTDEGEHVVSGVHQPTLTVYLPPAEQATGVAVVICPGGGHRELWMDHEGYNVARWLAGHGVAGLILKYRLAAETGSTYRVERESLVDGQRALRFAKTHAAEWGLDPTRIGILGFSAGGEVAARAASSILTADRKAGDPLEQVSSRPAFQVLIYPIGTEAIGPEAGAPPAFLLCGGGDHLGIAEALPALYARFKQAGVPAELHIYAGEGHGFGLRARNRGPAAEWPERLIEWMRASGWLERKR